MDAFPRRFRSLGYSRILGLEVPVASTFRSRVLGLALLDPERAPPGLLIPRCRSVHTFGMWFPLDVLFLDGEDRVIELRRGVPPNRVVRCPGSNAVLELPSPKRMGR